MRRSVWASAELRSRTETSIGLQIHDQVRRAWNTQLQSDDAENIGNSASRWDAMHSPVL